MQYRAKIDRRPPPPAGPEMAGADPATQRKPLDLAGSTFPGIASYSDGSSEDRRTQTASGTTTWYERNRTSFLQLARAAEELNLRKPVIVDIGPGGMSPLTAGFFKFSARVSNLPARSVCIKALKLIDTLIRNCFRSADLVTSEPFEILAALQELEPSSIFVIDRNQAVLRAFESASHKMGIETRRVSVALDLEDQAIPVQGDIVVATGVLTRRTVKRHELVSNICRSVRSGGLLCMNIDRCPDGFTPHGRFWRKL